MTPDELARSVQHLLDRQAIWDCLNTYSRAVDRLDRELLMSVYHPDAVDDHGAWVGDRDYFADTAFAYHRANQTRTQHVITNHTCEIDGATAHAETYWMMAAMNTSGAPLSLSGGRYIDRLEKRDGVWKIAVRVCVSDWHGQPGASTAPPEIRALLEAGTARDRTDPSYMRPLQIRTTARKAADATA